MATVQLWPAYLSLELDNEAWKKIFILVEFILKLSNFRKEKIISVHKETT